MNAEKKLTIWEHLAELIKRLRIILFSIIGFTLFFMAIPANPIESISNPYSYKPFVTLVINRLKEDLLPEGIKLIAGTWETPFKVYIYASLVLGLIASFPIIAYEIYAFLKPGLYESERKAILSFFLPFFSLFIFGIIFAYMHIIPISLKVLAFFGPIVGAEMWITVDSFFFLIIGMFIACGLFFTIPIIFTTLVKAGIVGTDLVAKRRKYIYGGLIIFLCILTPDPTPISTFILFIPFFIIMEICIYIARKYEKRAR